MKGRMDVLNLSNQRSSKSSTFKDVIKIEADDEREKENYGTDLVIDTLNKPMEVDLESVEASLSDDDVEMDDEEEVEMIPNLPLLSVIIKEDDKVLNYNDGVPLSKTRPDVEIKYEDDIEEEEYDSEDSVNIREMPPLRSRPGVESPDRAQPTKQTSSFLNSIDASMLNFAGNPAAVEQMFNGSRGSAELNGSAGRAGDSVLLSIVYATINVPFSQVSKFLQAYLLSKSQLSVIRKVRRQVKNRLYAQKCRRRRIAHIKNLSDELRQMKGKKEQMCNLRRELLAKKADIEKRYAALHDHVLSAVRERCRSENADSAPDSDEEESLEHYYQLKGERIELEEKKNRLEAEYHNLYTHVFEVISERSKNAADSDSDSCYTKTGVENPFNVQLCNMNIANELALLNQYYTKNNNNNKKGVPREQGDVESSVSMDGSRTSENKMSDFVDYESSASGVDDSSRTEENARDDLVEYDFREEGVAQPSTTTAAAVVVTGEARNIEDTRLTVDERGEDVEAVSSANSDDDEEEDTDDDDDDDEQTSAPATDELKRINESLETRKKNLQEEYNKLYDYVLKEAVMNEVEFLKTFTDYCVISLLETLRKT